MDCILALEVSSYAPDVISIFLMFSLGTVMTRE